MLHEASQYLQCQANGTYRYYRRVPKEVAQADGRVFVRASLKTKDRDVALACAERFHAELEHEWSRLAWERSGQAKEATKPSWAEARLAAIQFAREQNFGFCTVKELTSGPLSRVVGWVMGFASIDRFTQLEKGELGNLMQGWERDSYTVEELERVVVAAAYLVVRDGEHLLPLFQRLERETLNERERQAALTRAREVYEASGYSERARHAGRHVDTRR